MRKLLSSDVEVRKKIDKIEGIGDSGNVEIHDNPNNREVLGIAWNYVEDTFLFSFGKIVERKEQLTATKRNVLCILAGICDPLGITIPVTVSLKILFQALCVNKIHLHEELTAERKIPRCVYESCKAASK